MIELSDLRLGNYIYYPNRGLDPLYLGYNHIGTVCQIDRKNKRIGIFRDENSPTHENGVVLYIIDEIFPVELNENILKKCGFEKIINQKLYGLPCETFFQKVYDISIEKTSLTVIKNGDAYSLVIPSDGEFGCKFIPISIHLLQNIHFDLTGEELKIDLT